MKALALEPKSQREGYHFSFILTGGDLRAFKSLSKKKRPTFLLGIAVREEIIGEDRISAIKEFVVRKIKDGVHHIIAVRKHEHI